MGSFDNCCCCLAKKTSAIVCTSILLVASVYSLYSDVVDISTSESLATIMEINMIYFYASLAFDLILIATLTCLLVGICKDKLPLMKPFKIIYAIYLVFSFAAGVYYIFIYNKFINHLTDDKLKRLCDLFLDDRDILYGIQCLDYKSTLKSTKNISIFIAMISFVISIIYYITTYNYIKGLEKEDKEIKNVISIENPN